MPPNRKGLIAPEDSAALMDFRKIRNKAFSIDLFKYASIIETDKGMKIHSKQPVKLNTIQLKEKIQFGQRVISFEVKAGSNAIDAVKIFEGTTIGHKRIIQFPVITANYFEINILSTKAIPLLLPAAGFLIKN